MDNGRVREWIGPRIVPVFADQVQWNIDSTYDPLVMVQSQGETFMSRQYVPAGIPLPDTAGDEESNDYWVHMSNWNAQVEYYRQEVLAFDNRIDALEDALPVAAFSDVNTVDARFDAIEANSWVTTDRITDSAVTTDKINDGAVTSAKIADGAIATADIADSAVTTGKIDDGAVTSAKIADGTIATADIADRAITADKLATKKVLLIGDSYGGNYNYDSGGLITGWISRVTSILTNMGYSVYSQQQGGIGFATATTFSNKLEAAYASMGSDIARTITDIVVLGGYNDHNYAVGNIESGISNFMTYARQHFPNALVHVGAVGWGKNKTTTLTSELHHVIQTYQKASQYGAHYITNIEYALSNGHDLFKEDNFHPGNEGQIRITNGAIQGLFNGSANYFTDGISNGSFNSVFTIMQNGIIMLHVFKDMVFSITSDGSGINITADGSGTIQTEPHAGLDNIAIDFSAPGFQFFGKSQLIVKNTSNTFKTWPASFGFTNDGRMNFRVQCTNAAGSNWDSLNSVIYAILPIGSYVFNTLRA